MKPTAPIALVMAAALSAACHGDSADPAAPSPAVKVAAVATATVTDRVRLTGRVVPPLDRDATLAPRVEGVLREVSFRVGGRVAKGQTLAWVDTTLLSDALAAAAAAETSAIADVDAKRRIAERTRTLHERGVVSGEQAETDAAAAIASEAALAQAKAARTTAAKRREWAVLTAPFDGVVVKVLRHAGERVDGTPATPVVEVAAEHPVAVALDATAALLARLKVGQDAEIRVDAGQGTPIAARVTAVAAAIDPATGTGPVRLDPSVEDPSLLLGRVVEASIAVGRHDAALVVPATALRGGADGAIQVVVVSDHRAHVHQVVTGIRDGDRVEIVSGLSAADRIVVDDPMGLADGLLVRDGT